MFAHRASLSLMQLPMYIALVANECAVLHLNMRRDPCQNESLRHPQRDSSQKTTSGSFFKLSYPVEQVTSVQLAASNT